MAVFFRDMEERLIAAVSGDRAYEPAYGSCTLHRGNLAQSDSVISDRTAAPRHGANLHSFG